MDFEWVAIALGDVSWISLAFVLGYIAKLINLPPLVGFLITGFVLNYFGITSGETLQKLAGFHRRQLNIPIISLTGSNGKTTTKELIYTVLSKKFKTTATVGNLNNHIGVPLTLLKLNEKHRVAIIEMGASHKGEIQHLCAIAQPTTSILNNVGEAHLEGFGDLQGVASAKAEIITGLSASGTVVLNKEEPWFNQWLGLAGDRRVISFGWSSEADVWAEKHSLESGLLDGQFKTRFVMHYQQQSVTVELNLLG